MSLNVKSRTLFDGARNFWLRDRRATQTGKPDLGTASLKVFNWHEPRRVTIELHIRDLSVKRIVKPVTDEFGAMCRSLVTGHVPLAIFADYLEETDAARFGELPALMRSLESKTHNAVFDFDKKHARAPQPAWSDGTISLKGGTLLVHDARDASFPVRHVTRRRLEVFFNHRYWELRNAAGEVISPG